MGEPFYAQPLLRDAEQETEETGSGLLQEPERFKVRLFDSLEPVAAREPKFWTVALTEIEATDFNLSASRYKPSVAVARTENPPAEIIRQLQALEADIHEHLSRLLAMVEEVE